MMTDVQMWFISGVIAVAVIAVSVMYACVVVSSGRHKK